MDPFAELAEITRRHGAWLHVDGAYGGFAALSERGAEALRGMEEADSVTLDPHKWLYQPFEAGCLMVREGRLLDQAFKIVPDYLKEVQVGDQEVNFSDRSFQLTRASRAIKLWMSLRYFGVDAFRAAIDTALDLAQLAQERVQSSDTLELMLPTSLGITCFRRRFEGVDDEDMLARLNAQLVKDLEATGIGLVSSTRLRGRFAIRLCVMNHTTQAADVERVLEWLETAEVAPAPQAETDVDGGRNPNADVLSVRMERGQVDAEELGRLPFFAPLDATQLQRVASAARVIAAEPGEDVVRQWDAARDFYVIAAGTAAVHNEQEQVNELGPGDFFGELAALEWGASYGYPRLATVTATSPLTAVVLSADVLNALSHEVPEIARRLEVAVRERL